MHMQGQHGACISTCLGVLAGDSQAEVAAGTGLRKPYQALQLARLCSTC